LPELALCIIDGSLQVGLHVVDVVGVVAIIVDLLASIRIGVAIAIMAQSIQAKLVFRRYVVGLVLR
jgi:hypothetical protein